MRPASILQDCIRTLSVQQQKTSCYVCSIDSFSLGMKMPPLLYLRIYSTSLLRLRNTFAQDLHLRTMLSSD